MDCASCAAAIEMAVRTISGVKSASVNVASEKLFVETDGDISDEQIADAVEETGYRATPAEHMLYQHEHHTPSAHDQGKMEGHDHSKMESGKEIKALRRKLQIGIAVSVITLLWTFGGDSAAWMPRVPAILAVVALAAAVEFWVGRQFWRGMYFEFKRLRPGMDSLVALGTGAAYFFSAAVALASLVPQWQGKLLAQSGTYFDVAVVVTTFIVLGKYLEAKAKGSASEAITKLLKLQATTAHRVKESNTKHQTSGGEPEEYEDVPIEQIRVGDVLLVKQGEKVPADGTITRGSAFLDESMVTGESLPIEKKQNDRVIGSTINTSGLFWMKAEKVGTDTFLAHIVRIVQEAQSSKAPIQRLADKITGYFVPVVLVIASATFVAWLLVGPQPRLSFALINAVAVMVVACPCALGLATPIAVVTSTGRGAEAGIIIRNAQALETAGKTHTVILDKTGTITQGKPTVTDIRIASGTSSTADDILQIAASLGANTTHPLDRAVTERAKEKNIALLPVSAFKAMTGKGIGGTIGGKTYIFGSRQMVSDAGIRVSAETEKDIDALSDEGKTALALADGKAVLAVIGVADALKPSAAQAVAHLKHLGVDVWMITGDNQKTARAIAQKVDITNVLASVVPEQKSEKVKELQNEGRIVAMVGDGINDAPALTQADVGIAIGTGTDIAIESAGITLSSGDPMGIYKTIVLSRKTLANIKQNLFWAYVYNIALIPVAAGALYMFGGPLLNPIFAGAAMALSSLSVVLNSLRLKRARLGT